MNRIQYLKQLPILRIKVNTSSDVLFSTENMSEEQKKKGPRLDSR